MFDRYLQYSPRPTVPKTSHPFKICKLFLLPRVATFTRNLESSIAGTYCSGLMSATIVQSSLNGETLLKPGDAELRIHSSTKVTAQENI